jgi:hypothetical protein
MTMLDPGEPPSIDGWQPLAFFGKDGFASVWRAERAGLR